MPTLRNKLDVLIRSYGITEDVSHAVAIASITADLRHLADEYGVDYGHADSLGYSHYCEENGRRQKA
jgi:hypothetical protein